MCKCKADGGYCGNVCVVSKSIPHKHAEFIKAWADGAQIQEYHKGHPDGWLDIGKSNYPIMWSNCSEYRIKPEPMPDKIRYIKIGLYQSSLRANERHPTDDVMVIFDGETGKIKTVEILK